MTCVCNILQQQMQAIVYWWSIAIVLNVLLIVHNIYYPKTTYTFSSLHCFIIRSVH